MDYEHLAEKARAALIVAAMLKTPLTYSLRTAIGMREDVPLNQHIPRVLTLVSNRCEELGEWSLAALVVTAATGEPGDGYRPGELDFRAEQQNLFDNWAS